MSFFSIIIPSYNRYKTLKAAVDSVLSQTFRDFELIVVDDGSTDDTSEIKNEYGSSIKYVRQENFGVSKARNTGIINSCSPYIAFLDSDDVWKENKLEEHYSFIKENPDIMIHQTDEIWIRNGKRVNPKKRHQKKEGHIFIDSLDLCLISPSAVVLNRKLFEEYGMFDENLPVCEDYDLWLRITCEKSIGLIDKKLTIKYGGHESQLSRSYPMMDIYRIYSILKLLKDKGGTLKPEYLRMAEEAVKKKCGIINSGALKRDKIKLTRHLQKIIISLDEHSYNNIDFENLLRESPPPLYKTP